MVTKFDRLIQGISYPSTDFTVDYIRLETKAMMNLLIEHKREIRLVRNNGQICWIK